VKQKSLLILTSLILLITQFSLVQAQSDPIEVLSNAAIIDFPLAITFQLDYQSATEMDDISLFYAIDKRTCGDQARVHVAPDPETGQVSWEWDLTKSYSMPPGATLFWHWQLTDVDGNVLTTEEQTVLFDDPNFEWQSYEEGKIKIEWSVGNLQFAKDLYQIITQAVNSLSMNAGLALEGNLKVIIYPTSSDLAEAGVWLPEWVGGVAYPDFNIIVLAIAPNEYDWAKEVIAHELSHLITHGLIFNCVGGDIPTWLDEGIAMFSENPSEVEELDLVIRALENGKLPKLLSLANGFSADTDAAHLSYVQSSAVAHFLIDEYGKENLALLLEAIKTGRNFDPLMEEIYVFDTNELDSLFRISLGFDPLPGFDLNALPTEAPEKTPIPTIALATPMFQAAESTTTPEAVEASSTPDCALDPENENCSAPPSSEPSNPSSLSPLTIGIGAVILIIIVLAVVLSHKKAHRPDNQNPNKEG